MVSAGRKHPARTANEPEPDEEILEHLQPWERTLLSMVKKQRAQAKTSATNQSENPEHERRAQVPKV